MKTALLFLLALLLALAVAPAARACCIYNYSAVLLFVDGPRIRDYVDPGEYHCAEGTGGDYSIQARKSDHKTSLSSRTDITVDSYGEILVFRRQGNRWKMEAKDRHGKVTSVKYLKELHTD